MTPARSTWSQNLGILPRRWLLHFPKGLKSHQSPCNQSCGFSIQLGSSEQRQKWKNSSENKANEGSHHCFEENKAWQRFRTDLLELTCHSSCKIFSTEIRTEQKNSKTSHLWVVISSNRRAYLSARRCVTNKGKDHLKPSNNNANRRINALPIGIADPRASPGHVFANENRERARCVPWSWWQEQTLLNCSPRASWFCTPDGFESSNIKLWQNTGGQMARAKSPELKTLFSVCPARDTDLPPSARRSGRF